MSGQLRTCEICPSLRKNMTDQIMITNYEDVQAVKELKC